MKFSVFGIALALLAMWLNAADAARYECHRINNYCSRSAWMVFGYYDTKSSKYVTHGWWNIPGNKAKTYCFYRGESLWMYWDWDRDYGIKSDITFSLPGDWTACTCTVRQKIHYNYNGHPFYETNSKNIGKTCGSLGLRHCKYRKLEKIDSIKYTHADVRHCPQGRRLGDSNGESGKGLVIGNTVAYEDIPEDQLDEVVFVAEDSGIADAGLS